MTLQHKFCNNQLERQLHFLNKEWTLQFVIISLCLVLFMLPAKHLKAFDFLTPVLLFVCKKVEPNVSRTLKNLSFLLYLQASKLDLLQFYKCLAEDMRLLG